MTFEQWWKDVQKALRPKLQGLDAGDMPELVFHRDLYDDGSTPGECADVLLQAWVDEGDLPEEMLS